MPTITPEMARAELERRRASVNPVDLEPNEQRVAQRQAGRETTGESFKRMQDMANAFLQSPQGMILRAMNPLISPQVVPAALAGMAMAENAIAEPARMEQRNPSVPTPYQMRAASKSAFPMPLSPLVNNIAPFLGGFRHIPAGLGKALSGQSKSEIGDVNVAAGMPENAARIASLIQAGVIVPDAAAIGKGIGAFGRKAGRAISLGRELTEGAANDMILKATKELFPKATRTGQMRGLKVSAGEAFDNKIAEGVKEVVSRKGELLSDEAGQPLLRNPQTIKESADAIDAAKRQVWKEVEGIENQVGKRLWTYNPDAEIQSLKSLAKGKAQPIVNQISDIADLLESNRGASLNEVSENVVKYLNNESRKFLQGGDYNLGGIPAMIADKVRTSMDDGITKALGKTQYRELRRKYGGLLAMEKATVRRMNTLAGAAPKNIVDNLVDPALAAHVIGGILRRDMKSVASGIGAWGVKAYNKIVNHPDTITKNMYQQVDDILKRSPRLSAQYQKAMLGTQQAGRALYEGQAAAAMGAQRGVGQPLALQYKKQVPQPRTPAASPRMAEEGRVIQMGTDVNSPQRMLGRKGGEPLQIPYNKPMPKAVSPMMAEEGRVIQMWTDINSPQRMLMQQGKEPLQIPYNKPMPKALTPRAYENTIDYPRSIKRPWDPVVPRETLLPGQPKMLPSPKYQYTGEGAGQGITMPIGAQGRYVHHMASKEEAITAMVGKNATAEQKRRASIRLRNAVIEGIKKGDKKITPKMKRDLNLGGYVPPKKLVKPPYNPVIKKYLSEEAFKRFLELGGGQ